MQNFEGGFEGGSGSGGENLNVKFPEEKKVAADTWPVDIKKAAGATSEKSKGSLKNTLKKWAGISSIALATLTGEGCAPDGSKEDASDSAPAAARVEKKTNFSGYGVHTETQDGKLKSSSYGEESGGKKKFKGYGIER